MKIALAQVNTIIGDFEYNLNKILEYTGLASEQKADLVIFPELVLCGYPPKDLLLKRQFVEDNKKYLDILKEKANPNIALVVGFAEENKGKGKPLFDSLALIQNKKIICTRQKVLLPTYDVFDEDRYFEPAREIRAIDLLNKKIGLSVCEDIWQNDLAWTKPRYHIDPITKLVEDKIDFLINSSASPYFIGKSKIRESILKSCATKYKIPIFYVNQVGGNDELIFDGSSCVVDSKGDICLRLKAFQEDIKVFEYKENRVILNEAPLLQASCPEEEELLQAITCGLRDYILKCNFKKVLIGLSGGIDSALVAVLAAYAIGKENVLCIMMPSRYTSDTSIVDAKELASNLGVELKTISIEESFKTFLNLLKLSNQTTTEENIQSRIRGLILMALSNQSGALVLSTGNKSEIATGYCTLYGDMCGGLAVISDLPKTIVYKLAKYINKKEGKELIPKSIITKAPTAELKPNQKDEDTLPPYAILDQILNLYVEEHLPLRDIIKKGLPKETVQRVCNMIDLSEYKRKQASPGLKLTSRSFGYGWRMPIAQKYKEKIED